MEPVADLKERISTNVVSCQAFAKAESVSIPTDPSAANARWASYWIAAASNALVRIVRNICGFIINLC